MCVCVLWRSVCPFICPVVTHHACVIHLHPYSLKHQCTNAPKCAFNKTFIRSCDGLLPISSLLTFAPRWSSRCSVCRSGMFLIGRLRLKEFVHLLTTDVRCDTETLRPLLKCLSLTLNFFPFSLLFNLLLHFNISVSPSASCHFPLCQTHTRTYKHT